MCSFDVFLCCVEFQKLQNTALSEKTEVMLEMLVIKTYSDTGIFG